MEFQNVRSIQVRYDSRVLAVDEVLVSRKNIETRENFLRRTKNPYLLLTVDDLTDLNWRWVTTQMGES